LKIFFFSSAVFVILQSCGSTNTDYVYADQKPPVEAYSFADLEGKCGKCHPGNGVIIPLEEEAFRGSAKVKSEIESGDMPPNPAGFDKAKALAFFK
jgi:hypothetical protein